MGYLNKATILAAVDVKFEDVQVPEWGGMVCVRGLSGAERDDFEGSIVETKGKKTKLNTHNIRAKLVSLSVCDEDGERLFGAGDVRALGNKSAAALERVFKVAQRLSGISDEDVEELEKNSSDGQSASSTLD